mgnify:CR=1 FL=1
MTHNGVKYYFLDNEYYFKRTGLYGFYDDGERFAFFSRAILEMLFHVDFVPDVIHANDWQTALVPVYLNLYYRHLEQYRSIKTVFTIHNIQYQGKYGMEILEDTLAIGRQDAHLVEYDGCVNFMKGAIECADKVTTVSPSYAGEILDPWYSHGLDDLLRQKQYKLCGILNGIDVKSYDPAADPNLAANFDANSFAENKPKCKKELQEIFGLHDWPVPVVAMVTRLVGHKGVDLVRHVAQAIVNARSIIAGDVIVGGEAAQHLEDSDIEDLKTRVIARSPFGTDHFNLRKSYCAEDQNIIGAALRFAENYLDGICGAAERGRKSRASTKSDNTSTMEV